VQSIKAAPGKVYQRLINITLPIAKSAANATQPYVHRVIGFMAPYAKSVTMNRHVQAAYHHRFVQGGIERVSPYVARVAKHPKVVAVAEQLTEWAQPKAKSE